MYLFANVVIVGLIETKISILRSILACASIRHTVRFLILGIPIYNSEVPDTAGRKMRRRKRREKAIAKRFAFHENSNRQS